MKFDYQKFQKDVLEAIELLNPKSPEEIKRENYAHMVDIWDNNPYKPFKLLISLD